MNLQFEKNIEPSLRNYQVDAIDDITTEAADGNRRIVAVLPCGSGKTVIACKIIQNSVSNGQRVLFLAHRRELVWQTIEKLKSFGIEGSVLIPGEPYDPSALACVASIQTLHARAMRRKIMSMPRADLVICDEFAHAFSSGSWQKILAEYPKAFILGLTATPINRRGEGMGHCADAMVVGPSIQNLIDLGHLVKPKYFCPSLPDLQKIKIQAGDYVPGQLEKRMDNPKLIGDICENWARICPDRKTIVFASGIKHSIHIVESFRSIGVKAEHIDGDTLSEDRDKLIQRFRNGETQVVSNVGVLCLDSQTEILTTQGWIGMESMSYQHKVANWTNGGKVFFSKPRFIIKRFRKKNERMVVLETKNRSIRVTEDHRILHRWIGYRWTYRHAKDMIGRTGELPISGIAAPLPIKLRQPLKNKSNFKRRVSANSFNLRKKGLNFLQSKQEAARRIKRVDDLTYKQPNELSMEDCEIIGFWIGDGSRQKLQSGGVEYSLCQWGECKNIIARVDWLLTRCRIDFIKEEKLTQNNKIVIEWHLPRGTGFGSQARNGVYPIEPYLKKEPNELFWALNQEQFDSFLRGYWMADGCDHKDNIVPPDCIRICGARENLLSQLQAIACVRGYRASLRKNKNGKFWLWILSFTKKQSHIISKNTMQFECGFKKEKVWCVTSDSGNIITRRNGSVAVLGNTEGFDDPSASALIFARPTKSLMLYLQVAGRVLRPFEEKRSATIIDHAGVVYEHGLIEQDWEWKLEYDEQKTIGEAMRHKKKKQAKPIVCVNCKLAYEGRLSCPECGTCPVIKGKMVPTLEAYLQELNALEIPNEKELDKKTFYRELL